MDSILTWLSDPAHIALVTSLLAQLVNNLTRSISSPWYRIVVEILGGVITSKARGLDGKEGADNA